VALTFASAELPCPCRRARSSTIGAVNGWCELDHLPWARKSLSSSARVNSGNSVTHRNFRASGSGVGRYENQPRQRSGHLPGAKWGTSAARMRPKGVHPPLKRKVVGKLILRFKRSDTLLAGLLVGWLLTFLRHFLCRVFESLYYHAGRAGQEGCGISKARWVVLCAIPPITG
jgi:hypothetical protein